MKPGKNRLIPALLVIGCIAIVAGISQCEVEKPDTPQHQAAREHFQSKAEPTTKAAIWTDAKTFNVAVFNDGTNRNGYASYVCEVLAGQGLKGKGITVQVIDIANVLRKERWKKLGESRCA